MSANTVYLKDYTPPVYLVDAISLDIQIFADETYVTSTLKMTKQHEGKLVLLGRKLTLLSIAIDGDVLTESDYVLDDESLTVNANHAIGQTVTVVTKVSIRPQDNSELEGLYLAGTGSEAMYVTQCEPEGFRKITFYPDRPDVLSVFTTKIEADERFPTLLGNGNLIDKGSLEGGRHFSVWHDPIPKPSYLFACVVADLAVIQDQFITMQGRDVLLEIYAKPDDIDKCHVAMQALKDAMKWDEEVYGRAYDLDRFMIVAVSQFNMGAMENKGLNIFNTSCVLSDPKTATDTRNFNVKAVIGHEYFHNWTGNRITCRDWFQLCLKEGLTVYRDQTFSELYRSQAVQRIEDVGVLRSAQFTEDAGALAHPVRPESFVEINNFYTATIYEKGAEIVRMMANLLGGNRYRCAMDIYFDRHDGQAVTVEDFIGALATQDERINGFLAWYKHPGTPVLSGGYEFDDLGVTISLAQKTRAVAGFDAPKALPIPVDTAVFDKDTGELLASEMLLLTSDKEDFHLPIDLKGKTPLVSVLRGFSAPVILDFTYTDEELAKLVEYETDGFNQYQAMQLLINRYLAGVMNDTDLIATAQANSVEKLLTGEPMLAARLFDIPSETELSSGINQNYDPKAVKARRTALKEKLANHHQDRLVLWYQQLPLNDYEDTAWATGVRALRNTLLLMIASVDKSKASVLAAHQYDNASCMTEQFGALMAMVHFELEGYERYLADFYEQFKDDALVIDTWFMVQASSETAGADAIANLMTRDDFDWHTPNRVRAVLGAVANRPVLLWSKAGLDLYLSALTKLDGINPQLSARLLNAQARWYTLTEQDKLWVKDKLTAFRQQVSSKNVLEFCDKLLSADK